LFFTGTGLRNTQLCPLKMVWRKMTGKGFRKQTADQGNKIQIVGDDIS